MDQRTRTAGPRELRLRQVRLTRGNLYVSCRISVMCARQDRREAPRRPFSADARLEAGVLLRRLQGGEKLSLPQSRPLPRIGPRCHELRIVDEDKTWLPRRE